MNECLVRLGALTRRELDRVFRIWSQTIVPPVLTSVLFIVVFGYSLGSRIQSISGFSYIEFILPGLIMMSIILSTYNNTSGSVYLSKFQGNIQEWLVSPLSYAEIIAALTIGALARGLITGVLITLIALLFSTLSMHSVLWLLFFALMTSLLFSFAGIITGLWATSFDKMLVFVTFLITPLTYLGGVFYSAGMLPPMWQSLSKLNPIFYMVDGFRYSFLGMSDVPVAASALILLFLTLLFFILCVHLFRTGYKLRT